MWRQWRRLTDLRPLARRYPRLANASRLAMVFLAAFGGAYGFISGSRSPQSGYDPHAFAIGASFLFALSCVALAALTLRNRLLKRALRTATSQNEGLAARNEELRLALDRARRLIGAPCERSLMHQATAAFVAGDPAFAHERLHAAALRSTLSSAPGRHQEPPAGRTSCSQDCNMPYTPLP